MDLSGQASQARFASYVGALVEVIGHADRAEPLIDYCVGLLMPGERKSVEPMGAGPGFGQTSIAFTSGRPGALSTIFMVAAALPAGEATLSDTRTIARPRSSWLGQGI
jgi:SRSO17 transposase